MLTSKLISRILSILMIFTLTLAWIRPVEAASPSASAAALDPSPPAQTVKLIFIHHSTGQNWLQDGYGNLGQSLSANNYFVSDTNYGWGPNGIGDHTDIPNWTEWFSSASTPTYMNALYNESGKHSSYTRTLTDPSGENQIIMFKSCFPNSALEGTPNDPPSANGWLTVGHAKYVYNQILQYFGAHPEKLFVVITAPPLQDGTYAANARAFNEWLMNDWLANNNYTGTNVAVFDFYNVLTGPDNHHRYNNGAIEHVFTAGMNTLYYPSGGDDHPSAIGSQKATSEFVSLLNIFYHRWQAGSASKDITAFSFTSPAATGVITGTNIAVTVPFGTNVTALVPTITHNGASISPNSGAAQNFISPVTYTVTAGDATTKDYTVTVTVAGAFDSISRWSSSFDLSHGWTVANFVRTVGDVNHDGNADLIGFGQDGVYVALSNGSNGFGSISKWSSSFDLSHGWTVSQFVRTVGDVNNDGNADLIGFGQDGVYVALSNGSSSFGSVSKWSSSFDLSHGWTVANYVRTVGDVNHDGNADLIGFGSDGVYVALSNGSNGFGSISKWTSSFDLSHGWTVTDFVRTVGDVNHDGNADLIGFGSDGVYVALSNGSNDFGSISKWSSSFDLSHGWTVANFVRTVGDVNNDGYTDLIGFGQDGVYVALSNGSNGFGAISKWTSSFDLSHGWTVASFVRTVGNVNNDGKADLVGFGQDGVYIATAK